jgi:tetratricopeptide (TPR) repeat protein
MEELDSTSTYQPVPLQDVQLHSTFRDWKETPSLWNALDLINGALVGGQLSDAREAVEQVLTDENTPEIARELVRTLVNAAGQPEDELNDLDTVDRSQQDVRFSRSRLSEHPRDAIEWVRLSRAYTILGVTEKARRAIQIALSLAPNNRYVLRSGARLYVHQGDFDRAQKLLFRPANEGHDPWLLAAEIAVCSTMGRSSNLAKLGQRKLVDDVPPHDLTELAAAVGTLETSSGNLRSARKHLNQALVGANENSVAQINWISRNRFGEPIDTSEANPPRLYEAHAWQRFQEGHWNEASDNAERWLLDQPFSSHPGLLFSYIQSDMLGRHLVAENTLRFALLANPNDMMLKNNLAYALINQGKLREAQVLLGGINLSSAVGVQKLIVATVGLLKFRQGDVDEGRSLYLLAVQEAREMGDDVRAARALLYLAREEVTAKSATAQETVTDALVASEKVDASDVRFVRTKLLEQFASSKLGIPQGVPPFVP